MPTLNILPYFPRTLLVLCCDCHQMRQSDPAVVTALTHRPWSLSRLGNGTPRFPSLWKHPWMTLMDIALDWAHHHILWKLCGISAFLIQKNFVSAWVSDIQTLRFRGSFDNNGESFITILTSASLVPLQGLCPVLDPEGGGGGSLDSQQQRGERVLPGGVGSQLHHRQPCGRLWAPLLRTH